MRSRIVRRAATSRGRGGGSRADLLGRSRPRPAERSRRAGRRPQPDQARSAVRRPARPRRGTPNDLAAADRAELRVRSSATAGTRRGRRRSAGAARRARPDPPRPPRAPRRGSVACVAAERAAARSGPARRDRRRYPAAAPRSRAMARTYVPAEQRTSTIATGRSGSAPSQSTRSMRVDGHRRAAQLRRLAARARSYACRPPIWIAE